MACYKLGTNDMKLQVLLALPFLQTNPIGYISKSFELSRQFLFKWTVNWRFIGEETFLSREFSLALLVLHISLLALFAAVWVKPSGTNMLRFFQNVIRGRQQTATLSKAHILASILSSLVVGLMCARSLHYQFYAYLALATPVLLWLGRVHPVLILSAWAMQEWAWNVFPSTSISSKILVSALILQVAGIWFGLIKVDAERGRVAGGRTARPQ
jgi:alpha-1,3-mannosyltransferase